MEITLEFIKSQKKLLEEKRQSLLDQIKDYAKEDPYIEEAQDAIGRNIDDMSDFAEEAQEDVGHENIDSIVSDLKSHLEQVEKALKAIVDDKYGIDESTGEKISVERLKAYPEATTAL